MKYDIDGIKKMAEIKIKIMDKNVALSKNNVEIAAPTIMAVIVVRISPKLDRFFKSFIVLLYSWRSSLL